MSLPTSRYEKYKNTEGERVKILEFHGLIKESPVKWKFMRENLILILFVLTSLKKKNAGTK